MRRQLLAFATVLILAAPAWGDWDDGQAAYERGDYETAFEEFRPYPECLPSAPLGQIGCFS